MHVNAACCNSGSPQIQILDITELRSNVSKPTGLMQSRSSKVVNEDKSYTTIKRAYKDR